MDLQHFFAYIYFVTLFMAINKSVSKRGLKMKGLNDDPCFKKKTHVNTNAVEKKSDVEHVMFTTC